MQDPLNKQTIEIAYWHANLKIQINELAESNVDSVGIRCTTLMHIHSQIPIHRGT